MGFSETLCQKCLLILKGLAECRRLPTNQPEYDIAGLQRLLGRDLKGHPQFNAGHLIVMSEDGKNDALIQLSDGRALSSNQQSDQLCLKSLCYGFIFSSVCNIPKRSSLKMLWIFLCSS